MAITRIGGTSGVNSGAGSVSLTLPGSMAVDDLILIAWACGDDDFTQPTLAMTTAGYTELTTSTLSADGGTAGDGNLAVFYKYHNGSDTTAVTAASGTGADSSNAVALQVFRGVANDGLPGGTGPLEIAIATASGTTTGDPNPPSVSTFTEATAVVVVATASSGSAAPNPVIPAAYATNAVTISEGTETFRAGVSLCYREDPADPEDPAVFTSTGAGAWCAATLVLKEGAAIVNATVTPGVIARSFVIPAITKSLTAEKVAPLISRSFVIPAPTISTGGEATVTPGVIARAFTIPAVTVSAGVTKVAPLISRAFTIPAVTIQRTATVLAPVINLAANIWQVTIDTGGAVAAGAAGLITMFWKRKKKGH